MEIQTNNFQIAAYFQQNFLRRSEKIQDFSKRKREVSSPNGDSEFRIVDRLAFHVSASHVCWWEE